MKLEFQDINIAKRSIHLSIYLTTIRTNEMKNELKYQKSTNDRYASKN